MAVDGTVPPPLDGDVLDTTEAGPMIIRGGILRGGAYAAGSLLSALSAALVAQHLGPSEFGRYVTVFSLMSIVAAITDGGLSSLGIREYAQREGADRDRLMRVLLGLRTVLSLAGIAGALAFALAAGYSGPLLLGTALAGVGLLLTMAQGAFAVPLQARLRFGTVAGLELLRQAATVAGLVALVLAGAGVAPLLGVTVPVGIVLVAATAWLARGLVPMRPAWDPVAWRGLMKLTFAFALAAAVGTLYVYTAQLITSLVADADQVGYFGVSFRIFLVIAAVPGLVVSVAFPLLARAARDDQVRLRYALQRLFEVSLVGGSLFAIGTCVGAPFAVKVIGGADYAPAAGALRIQGAALLFSFLLSTWSFALISLHHHRVLVLTNLSAFLASSILTFALAPGHGARGAAIATVVGEAVLAAGCLIALVRARPDLRPDFGIVPRVVLAAAVAVGVAVVSGLPALPNALVAAALYTAGVLVLRAVPEELLVLVRRRRA